MKTVKGAVVEFDLNACMNIVDPRQRALAHQVFLTGFTVGYSYVAKAFESCSHDDLFEAGRFQKIMQDYVNQIVTAQSEIKV